MTNRKDWALGCSSVITTDIYGISDYAFKMFSLAGIKNMEISLLYNYFFEFDFVKNKDVVFDLAKKYDINIWSLHIPFSQDYHPALLDEEKNAFFMSNCLKQIEAAISIGIKTIVIHPSAGHNEDSMREKIIQRSIENLTILSNYCHEKGAVLAVEDLPGSCLGNCSDEMIRFIKEVPYLEICYDTNHISKQKNEVFLDELIKNNLKGKIRTIHVSDYDFINEKHWLPFEGVNNWEDILSKLEMLDYNGIFMYEVSKGRERNHFFTPEQVVDNFNKLMNK